MPRTARPPSYRSHKARNCAVVTLDGKNSYLGAYGSPESKERYARLIAEAQVSPPRASSSSDPTERSNLSVNELILVFWKHARSYYVKNGHPTDELAGIRAAIRFVRRLYGSTLAAEFGPLKPKTVRQTMIEANLARGVINQYVNRIRRMFRWGVEHELLPVETYQSLMTVGGLRKGRTDAQETSPVKPVPNEHVEAALASLSEVVQAMVRFQRLTGCRPKDVCVLRPCDVDVTGEIWCYRPFTHKTEHQQADRRIYVGPQAQAVLEPYLDRPCESYRFSPKEAATLALAIRRKNKHDGKQRGRSTNGQRRRAPGDHYTRFSYRQAIERACIRAGVPKWTPKEDLCKAMDLVDGTLPCQRCRAMEKGAAELPGVRLGKHERRVLLQAPPWDNSADVNEPVAPGNSVGEARATIVSARQTTAPPILPPTSTTGRVCLPATTDPQATRLLSLARVSSPTLGRRRQGEGGRRW